MHKKALLKVCQATLASGVMVLVVGCTTHDGCPTCPTVLTDRKFRSFAVPPIVSNRPDCENTRLTLPLTGKRPLCAETRWIQFGLTSSGACMLKGVKTGANCKCYEGQAHACDIATGGPCPTGAPNCGVKACLDEGDDLTANWSVCTRI